ncbi:hypothetical protein [Priestia megaterium]|uniref:hypothetical protein n=1 Tax=Priestia megaterium TaxID=1404 RepID=UPI002E1F7883|nr:hypothetical protein [Priestia megaterium]
MKALIAIGIIFCCLAGCSSSAQVTNDKEMAKNIQKLFVKKDVSSVDVSKLSDFKWEKGYLLTNTSKKEDVEKLVNAPISKEVMEKISSADQMLVFVHEGEVVRYVELPHDFITQDKSELEFSSSHSELKFNKKREGKLIKAGDKTLSSEDALTVESIMEQIKWKKADYSVALDPDVQLTYEGAVYNVRFTSESTELTSKKRGVYGKVTGEAAQRLYEILM